jgi:uncharacterized protein
MKKIRLGNTNIYVSKVGMGGIPITRLSESAAIRLIRNIIEMGINFIDTGNRYGDSEKKIGKAIKQYKREKIILSSKSRARDKKGFLEHIDLSLKRLGTDYIDIYQLHEISTEEDFKRVLAKEGAFTALEEAIAAGKVRYPGFSSHSTKIAEKIINTKKFPVTQIPFNFVDNEAEKILIPLSVKLGVGFIAMKPMGGGLLDDAKLAFKYLSQFESIIPDPGIEKIEEMEEIVKIIKNPEVLTEKEKEEIEKIKRELGDSWCHRCEYCQPCPRGISISKILIMRSMLKRVDFNSAVLFYKELVKKAKDCTECRKCVERCPYNLDIPELLKDNIGLWERYCKEHQ